MYYISSEIILYSYCYEIYYQISEDKYSHAFTCNSFLIIDTLEIDLYDKNTIPSSYNLCNSFFIMNL